MLRAPSTGSVRRLIPPPSSLVPLSPASLLAGDHFQTYLLVQSLLMIATQFGLLYVCLLYRPADWTEHRPRRIGNLWQWSHFAAYLEFTAILIVAHSVLFIALHRFDAYVQLLGFLALGLEATVRPLSFLSSCARSRAPRPDAPRPASTAAPDPATARQLRGKVDGRVPHDGPRRLGHRRRRKDVRSPPSSPSSALEPSRTPH